MCLLHRKNDFGRKKQVDRPAEMRRVCHHPSSPICGRFNLGLISDQQRSKKPVSVKSQSADVNEAKTSNDDWRTLSCCMCLDVICRSQIKQQCLICASVEGRRDVISICAGTEEQMTLMACGAGVCFLSAFVTLFCQKHFYALQFWSLCNILPAHICVSQRCWT